MILAVFSSPKGLPTAIAQSPTFIFEESPNIALGHGPSPLSLIIAISVSKSCPINSPLYFFPFDNPTINFSDPLTTCAFVITRPSPNINPLP